MENEMTDPSGRWMDCEMLIFFSLVLEMFR